jgi:hypothetical protein
MASNRVDGKNGAVPSLKAMPFWVKTNRSFLHARRNCWRNPSFILRSTVRLQQVNSDAIAGISDAR